jgi:hypothetical protein
MRAERVAAGELRDAQIERLMAFGKREADLTALRPENWCG